ncbi:hypothetical protein ACLB2K_020780 [Fragaria x ananassa]
MLTVRASRAIIGKSETSPDGLWDLRQGALRTKMVSRRLEESYANSNTKRPYPEGVIVHFQLNLARHCRVLCELEIKIPRGHRISRAVEESLPNSFYSVYSSKCDFIFSSYCSHSQNTRLKPGTKYNRRTKRYSEQNPNRVKTGHNHRNSSRGLSRNSHHWTGHSLRLPSQEENKQTQPNFRSSSYVEKKPDIVIKVEASATKPSSWSYLTIKGEETSEATSSDSDHDDHANDQNVGNNSKRGVLITVDGEPELELETLLKASAYVLGASGPSIVYKAVLEDITALAVRRIGESVVEKMRDFENQVRAIAMMRHPNLVRVRGFYWGEDEKLVIYDYVSNGSLAGTVNRKTGSSPYHLPLQVRLKIARGIARGLGYIHEKKNVHGNIKPSNILLNSDFDPVISDFGLDKLMLSGMISHKGSGSARGYFGSLKSAGARKGFNDMVPPVAGSPIATSSSAGGALSPYQAPESLKNLNPNPKWDVYSFGIVLLELLTGRVFSERELADQWTAGSLMGEKNRVLVMVDVAIRAEVEGREDALQACLKLGFSCASFVPQKRPTMKEALQVLDKSISSNQ